MVHCANFQFQIFTHPTSRLPAPGTGRCVDPAEELCLKPLLELQQKPVFEQGVLQALVLAASNFLRAVYLEESQQGPGIKIQHPVIL